MNRRVRDEAQHCFDWGGSVAGRSVWSEDIGDGETLLITIAVRSFYRQLLLR